jgi:hypothetical protein
MKLVPEPHANSAGTQVNNSQMGPYEAKKLL